MGEQPDVLGGAGLVVGVDAGGTSTRAGLADARGRVLRTGRAGPGNALSVPVPELAGTLARAIAEAVPAAERARVGAVVGGFAGASAEDLDADGDGHAVGDGDAVGVDDGDSAGAGMGGPRAVAALRDALRGLGIAPGVVEVRGDVEIAFASAPGAPRAGLALIAGTGAVAARMAERRVVALVDGHGWLLGDAGSGYWIGRQAVRAVLRVLDGREPWTALVPAVTGHLTGGPLDAIPMGMAERRRASTAVVVAAQSRPPARLGLLCPLVVTAADSGDTSAVRILDGAADRLTDTVRALGPHPGEPLVTAGGLLSPGGPLLDRVRARTTSLGLRLDPVADGVQGACTLAAESLAAVR